MFNSASQIIQQPLESVEFAAVLSSFGELLQSALGPHGGLKMLVTGGGYTIITSTSSRILNNIVLDHPVCLFISQVMKAQLQEFKDCGLFTGILTSSILRHALSRETVPFNAATILVQQISSYMIEQVNSVKINVDFSTVQQLMPLVKSILGSKPGCRLSKTDEHLLSIKIVKAFLGSVSDYVGDVIVLTEESSDFQNSDSLYPGVLYQRSSLLMADENLCKVLNNMEVLKKPSPVIIFNIMLSNEKSKKRRDETRVCLDVEKEECFNVEKAMQVLTFAVQLGVTIVACQKVVHPNLCLFLERNGILLLDRMGTELTHHLVKLSGAKPISDIGRCVDKEFLDPYLGKVSAVRNIQRGQKSYVSLERGDRNVTTLVVGGINSEASAELKVTTEQVLQSLRHLLADPYLLPGAGCVEMVLVAGLESKVQKEYEEGKFSHSLSHVRACLRWLQLSILSAGGFSTADLPSHITDTAYYHAWQPTDDADWSTCRCGLVTAAMVHARDKDWIYLDLNASTLLSGRKISESFAVLSLNENSIVDLFASKFNAMKLSMESFSGIMNIGMIVYRPTK